MGNLNWRGVVGNPDANIKSYVSTSYGARMDAFSDNNTILFQTRLDIIQQMNNLSSFYSKWRDGWLDTYP